MISQTNPTNRDSQMFEIYQFVEATRGSMPVILVGDFNTKPKHLAYSVLTKCLRLQDVFQDNPVDTCDRKSNVFTESRMTPKRIDFVLFSPCEALELKVRLCCHHSNSNQFSILIIPIPGPSIGPVWSCSREVVPILRS